jgi:ATP-dependent DNA helicase DinG
VLGAEVLALREWAEGEATAGGLADRDHAPSHTDRAWQQVSIPVRECLSPQRCPYGDACFVEQSRDEARAADLVVTNHALLAINAMHGGTALPEHDAVIIDEAHELVSRVTGAASSELAPAQIERVARRAMTYLEDEEALALLESADSLRQGWTRLRWSGWRIPIRRSSRPCGPVRNAARSAVSAMVGNDEKPEPDKRQASAAVKEIFDIAERMAALSSHDVVWVADRERMGPEARVAPLSVAALMRSSVFGAHTVVLTSATLKLGGEFTGIAGSVGLRADERIAVAEPSAPADPAKSTAGEESTPDDEDDSVPWRALDVGSPFDYRRQGILYVARSLPPPGRDGLSETSMAEIAELVWASGGRTLGLFSSRRAAEAAAVHTS